MEYANGMHVLHLRPCTAHTDRSAILRGAVSGRGQVNYTDAERRAVSPAFAALAWAAEVMDPFAGASPAPICVDCSGGADSQ